ncbi:serine hydrolase domain-containing protein [Catellatospora chokoriensis]|uniref:D-Ala-D-Ala carboxypeptidase n=1 Tax=Catellatospora chokoriensis TaxID=310353 RepID=A0A8J3K9Q8_9ACTN|nr:serine hydrolase domain-containing protein [Catellatospora chokoriensis]GIF91134.1 D-Ala-D-Ala carboxypeptidase [Catellatospora chokoriensis]
MMKISWAKDGFAARLAELRRRVTRPVGFAGLAACAAFLLTGCSVASTVPSTAAVAPGAGSVPGRLPIDQAALQAAVETAADQMMVPGALVLVRTPQGTYRAVVGTTELGAQTPPAGDTHFRIASNTKTMTAALIVLLAQDGKLKFSDPVSKYVPGVPNGEHITLADLLKMRSGLYGYTGAPEMAAAMDADLAKVWTPQEVLDIAFKRPPNFAPNTDYEYSNTNYALLGLVAEKVGGRPLAEQFTDRLYAPLGLRQTSLPAATDDTLPQPFSRGYMYGGTAYALVDDPYPADMQAAIRAGTLKPIDYTNQNPSYATAAGGAISTADDLAKWIDGLVSGKVLNADFQQQWRDSLQAEDPATPDGQQYGYGISYQRFAPNAAMYYHGGELPGFNSFMGHDVDNDVTVVIWTNLTVSPEGKTTAQALLPIVLDEIYGLDLVPAPTPTR